MRLRQWVLSVPFELRLLLARNSDALSTLVRTLVSEIDKLTKRLGDEPGVHAGATGFVAAMQ